jgi:hypothetical protein
MVASVDGPIKHACSRMLAHLVLGSLLSLPLDPCLAYPCLAFVDAA